MATIKTKAVQPLATTWTTLVSTASGEQLVFSKVSIINTSTTTSATVTLYRRLTADTRALLHSQAYQITIPPVSVQNNNFAEICQGTGMEPSSTFEVYSNTADVVFSATYDLSSPS